MTDEQWFPDPWLADLLARVGQPVPCDICGTPTPTADLTETTMPGAIVRFANPNPELAFSFVARTVIWICPTCLRDGWADRPSP